MNKGPEEQKLVAIMVVVLRKIIPDKEEFAVKAYLAGVGTKEAESFSNLVFRKTWNECEQFLSLENGQKIEVASEILYYIFGHSIVSRNSFVEFSRTAISAPDTLAVVQALWSEHFGLHDANVTQ